MPDRSADDSQRFTKREHLRLKSDFARVFSARTSCSDGAFVVYILSNALDYSRLGIVVGRRVGNAVRRSRVRRRVREAFRTTKSELPRGLDVVCIALPGSEGADAAASLESLIPRALKRKSSTASSPK